MSAGMKLGVLFAPLTLMFFIDLCFAGIPLNGGTVAQPYTNSTNSGGIGSGWCSILRQMLDSCTASNNGGAQSFNWTWSVAGVVGLVVGLSICGLQLLGFGISSESVHFIVLTSVIGGIYASFYTASVPYILEIPIFGSVIASILVFVGVMGILSAIVWG